MRKKSSPWALVAATAPLLCILPVVLSSPTLSDFTKGLTGGLFVTLAASSLILAVLKRRGMELTGCGRKDSQ
ncbi:hypothetical protein Q5741_08090 [Paenibacillus sp. JX-17]|uniref:Uncharacterized protein n=1 Tax=Paenibacillus lacisoli TaxID=3064525 RepID=A0ABT9CAT1_9BACL|nr:hypothetical protein [Paenibacillus sp. JX-17]MDO7906375.1 hypothetical protein [Paenibacillus sp. JX-17]